MTAEAIAIARTEPAAAAPTDTAAAPGGSYTNTPRQSYFLTAEGFTAGVEAFALEPHRNYNGEITDYYLHLLSLVGGQNALKALRAILRRPNPARLSMQSADPELAAGFGSRRCQLNPIGRSHWRHALNRLPQSGLWHLLLYPSSALPDPDPNRSAEENRVFTLLSRNDRDPVDRYHLYVDRRTDLPIHPYWAGWLWSRGQVKNQTEPLESFGISAWQCRFVENELRDDLSAAVKSGLLNIPKGE